VVVAGELKDHRTQALLTAARSAYHPGMVLSLVTPNSGLPLHEDRGPIDGQPAVYLCRGQSCLAPVTDAEGLRAQLASAKFSP
ncbi:MAG: hypothetical protein LWX11_11175, partial [Firmicutes bacterium]|nr:hypothetical protein [Bacillota bacterium]